MSLSPRVAPALACALLLSGCATLLAPRHPAPAPAPLHIAAASGVAASGPDGAPLDVRLQPTLSYAPLPGQPAPASVSPGRRLHPTFFLDAIGPWVVALGVVTFRDEPRAVPALSLAIASTMAVDLLTGAAWERPPAAPRRVTPPPLPPPPPPARDIDAEIARDPALAATAATLLLRQMARTAEQAGCNRIVSEAWLDQSDRVQRPGPVAAADSAAIDERVRRDASASAAELRRLCARSNPLLDSLAAAQIPAAPAHDPAGAVAEAGAAAMCAAGAFGHCITFRQFSAEIRPEFVPALDDVAARLRALRLPVLIVIVGTADDEGDVARNHGQGLARAVAVRDALVGRGVPREWLFVESCGSEERCQLVPGATGSSTGAELNRRVMFHLRLKENTP